MSSQSRTAQPGTAAGQKTSDDRSEAMDTTQQSHQRHGLSAGPTQTTGTAGPAESDAARLQSSKAHFYDSDADSLGSELISEEDVLYSEGEDERDELWAQQQRQGRHSDAILSCPGEPLSLLCAAVESLLGSKCALVRYSCSCWVDAGCFGHLALP